MQKNNEWEELSRKRLELELVMTDEETDLLVAELAVDGIVVSREEAQRSVYRLAELLLLIGEPLPLPPVSASPVEEGQSHERDK